MYLHTKEYSDDVNVKAFNTSLLRKINAKLSSTKKWYWAQTAFAAAFLGRPSWKGCCFCAACSLWLLPCCSLQPIR